MSQTRTTNGIRTRTRTAKELATIRKQRRNHILEHVALSQDFAPCGVVESVATVGVPVVVDCVYKTVSADLWAASTGVVDVVTLHGDEVLRAGEVDGPVVVAVARCGPGGGTVEFVVGQGDAVGGAVAGDEHLATDERDLDVICEGRVSYAREDMGRGRFVPIQIRSDPSTVNASPPQMYCGFSSVMWMF